jgi:hypothetical protein
MLLLVLWFPFLGGVSLPSNVCDFKAPSWHEARPCRADGVLQVTETMVVLQCYLPSDHFSLDLSEVSLHVGAAATDGSFLPP